MPVLASMQGRTGSLGCRAKICGEDSYSPRQPEQTVLYQVLAEHLETFLTRPGEEDRQDPRFVEREFRKFLECGIPVEYAALSAH
jgi:hypothetical protein